MAGGSGAIFLLSLLPSFLALLLTFARVTTTTIVWRGNELDQFTLFGVFGVVAARVVFAGRVMDAKVLGVLLTRCLAIALAESSVHNPPLLLDELKLILFLAVMLL